MSTLVRFEKWGSPHVGHVVSVGRVYARVVFRNSRGRMTVTKVPKDDLDLGEPRPFPIEGIRA